MLFKGISTELKIPLDQWRVYYRIRVEFKNIRNDWS